MTIPNAFRISLAVALAFGCGLLSGCSGSDKSGRDTSSQEKSVENAKTMRTLFDKVGGDFDKLSPEDKAAFIKLFENEAKAMDTWNRMKSGPGGAPRGETAVPGS